MADGSIIIEVKGDAEELERALKNVSRSADTLEDAVKDVASAFKKVESAADDVDGDGLKDAARDADKLDDALDDAAQAADRLGDEVEGSSGGVSKLSGGFSVLKGAAAGVVAELAGRAIDAFVELGSEAINAADSLTKFESTMSFAGFSTAEIDAARDAVQNYASQTVYDLDEVANTTAQLAANGVQDYQKLTEAAGNLNAVAGGSADTFGSVAMVLTQTAGAGKLTTENWNQLSDAIPGASGVIQNELKAMGAYTGDFRDAMANGEISAEEFNQAIMNLGFSEAAVEASSSVSTIEGAVGNLRATIVDGFVSVLTDGGLMEGITGFINGIATILTNAGQYIGPAIQSIKDSITGIGDAFRNAFGEERSAAILNFLSQLASAMIAVPFQVVAAAVEVVATAFELLIGVVGGVVDFFTGSLPNAFNSAKESVTRSVETLKSNVAKAWDNLKSSVSSTMEKLKSDITKAWDNIKSAISKALDSIKSTVKSAWDNVKSTVSSVLDNIKSTVTNVWNNIKSTITNAVNNVKSSVSSAFESIKSTISSTLNAAKSTALSVFDAIKSAITDKINAARDAVQRAIDKIKSIMNFSWSLPKLKLPHISISGGFSINPPSAPKFSISWYKKGGVMMDPTIFGMAGRTLLGGGEAGPEAIAPISVLQDYVSEAVTEAMAEFTSELKTAVEEETAAISAALGNRANPEGGSVNNSYGGTTINIYVDGTKAETPQQARDLGRELGGELNREMRRRGLVPA